MNAVIEMNLIEKFPMFDAKTLEDKIFDNKICAYNEKLYIGSCSFSIMRTYSSTGQMKRPFYNSDDPFCENREPNAKEYALDLFYE